MTLRARLAVGLISIAAILVAPLIIAVRALSELHASTEQLQAEAVAGSAVLRQIQSLVDDARLAEDALLFVHDPISLARMRGAATNLGVLADSLSQYGLTPHTIRLRRAARALSGAAEVVYSLAIEGRAAEAERAADERVRPPLAQLDLEVHTAERALHARTQETVREASQAARDARRAAALALLLALGAGAAIALLLAHSISEPVAELERGMRTVAAGDFAYELALKEGRTDEFGRLASSFRTMTTQLSELDRMKSEFVSIATHELKTPINVIIGYVQLLEDGIYGPLEDRQVDACRTVARQARSLDRLVRRLLDVSRFEAGAVTLDIGVVSPAALAEDVRADFRVISEQRGITLSVDVAPQTPAAAWWDADRVGEVLGNLVSNALNFTAQGGRVEMLLDVPADGVVRIRVSDTGVGISPDQLPHVFQKFYQARNQSSARAKGSGLGLAIVKEIVEAHGGTIGAESVIGRGTVFTIVLPVRAPVAARRPVREPRAEEALA